MRNLEKVLALEQQVRARRGGWAGSVNSTLDGIKLGQDISNGTAAIGLLISVACQAIARADVWPRIGHLSSGDARSATRRLERVLSASPSLPDSFRSEKAWCLRFLSRKMRQPDWSNVLAEDVIEGQKSAAAIA